MPARNPARPAGPRDAITDVPGIKVGHWTDRRAATGCTVVLCEAGAVGGVDVRGAAPGTRETDLLRPGNTVVEAHAVVLAGGSAFGLEAATGVMQYLAERGIGFAAGDIRVPIVPAAILFDLAVGEPRWPDAAAGYRAARAATSGRVAQGSVGAGAGASIAKFGGRDRALKGGLGTASEQIDGGAVVGAIVAVNAVGSITDPATGEIIAAPRGERGEWIDGPAHFRTGRPWGEDTESLPAAGANTTLAVVATSARLSKEQANRLATVCHDGFARTTWPAHTSGDGDAIFVLATGRHELEPAGYLALEAYAVRAVERGVLNGVRLATGVAGLPSAGEWRSRRPPARRQVRGANVRTSG